MKNLKMLGALSALLVASLVGYVAAVRAPAQQAAGNEEISIPVGEELTWPRVIKEGAETLSVYQPQIEKLDGTEIACRAAVSVQSADGGEPVYGVAWITASADVDKAARVVTLQNFQVTKVSFPTVPEKDAPYLEMLRKLLPTGVKTIALDHLEASLAVSQAVKKQVALDVKNEPPHIFFSTSPAILALVDGQPVLRPMPGLDAERVLNTRALIVKLRGVFYLTAERLWYEAPAIEGPWTLVDDPPRILAQVEEAAVATKMVDLMQPMGNAPRPETPPTIHVSTVPAELIQTDGPQQMIPIEGTNLLQAENSDDVIVMDISTNRYYVLLSGRWFSSKSLYGPWEFVSAKSLPADFAKIPPDHSRGNALVSVAGTPEAEEALIANSIPQTATVNRGEARLEVTYDGPPQFQPIPGTSLQYAVNSSPPVIQVGPEAYYCVQNGVWFTASTPQGPWVVATAVPPSIYAIPPSSPVHNDTYVYVFDSTPDTVYVGYTPGYLGTCVSTDGCVVYGTGYSYPGYCGNLWFGCPCTYGFHACFACDTFSGFGFGFALGGVPGACPRPWWGPFGWAKRHDFDYNHINVNHVNIYRHWDEKVVASRHPYEGNHWDGNRWSNVREPFSPYSARSRTSARSWEANARRGASPSVSLPATRLTPDRGRANMNSVFAGKGGEVYRHAPTTGWQQYTRNGWQNATENRAFQQEARALNSERSARDIGATRVNNFRASGGFVRSPSFAPSRSPAPGGGGPRGGGSRGR